MTDSQSKFELSELRIERGYLNAEVVVELHNKARFRALEKNQFHIQAVAAVNNCNVLNALFGDREAA